MKTSHLKNTPAAPTLIPRPETHAGTTVEEITMAYILSMSVLILGLSIWQDKSGSAHAESDLGSERYGQYS